MRPRRALKSAAHLRDKRDMGSTRARRRVGADSTNTVPPLPGSPIDAAKQPYLIVIAGGNLGELYKIAKQRVVIGRSPDADIRTSDDGVSREHVELLMERGSVLVRDLGSTNGTYVNGTRADAVEIADGDKISVGATTILKFSYQDGIDELYEQGLYRSAVRDGLTRALKREFLLERLETEIAFAVRHGSPVALILLDLDNFKSVNDRFGHPTGDRVLQEMACTVAGVLRQGDFFGRYGGEEFGVVCRLSSPEEGLQPAERLRVAIEQTGRRRREGTASRWPACPAQRQTRGLHKGSRRPNTYPDIPRGDHPGMSIAGSTEVHAGAKASISDCAFRRARRRAARHHPAPNRRRPRARGGCAPHGRGGVARSHRDHRPWRERVGA